MSKWFKLGGTLIVGVSIAAAVRAQSRPIIRNDKDAKKYLGEVATICGRVVVSRCKAPDRVTFLDVEVPPSQGGIAIKIPSRIPFGQRLEDRYVLANVCATGPVERKDGSYTVLAAAPSDIQTTDTPVPLSPGATDVFRPCDDGVTPPVLRPGARLPEGPRGGKSGAEVLVEGVVLQDGTVQEARVVYSSDPAPIFGEVTIAAFKTWRWTPGLHNGSPGRVVVTSQVVFR